MPKGIPTIKGRETATIRATIDRELVEKLKERAREQHKGLKGSLSIAVQVVLEEGFKRLEEQEKK